MKYTFLAVAALVAFLGTVKADSVSCSVIDYLYYSSDCCDNSNAVQCMESIPQTDKAAIDNLASLKRSDGTACQSGDSVKFLSNIGTGSSGIVCADEDACVIPCLNGGTISGTLSGDDCLCTCATGFSGGDCGTVIPCPTVCQNNGTVNGTVAGGDCGCNCTATGGYTGDNCENAPAGAAGAASYSVTIAEVICSNSYGGGGSTLPIAAAESQEDHLARCKAQCDAESDCTHISKSIDSCWTTRQPTCTELANVAYTTYVK